ncbi:MAG: hypothetical protein JWP82_409 [Humibacillus sp.]|nr:hypothetical protein [Humibacillus sp.]
MTTMTPRPDATATPSRPRLRQLCAAALVVPALALGACSSTPSGTDAPSASGSTGAATPSETSSTAATTSAAPTTSATTATTPTPTTAAPTTPAKPALPVDKTTYTNPNVAIRDGDLGHTITATRLARQLSWPAGQPVGAQQFEIVGVRVRFEAGARYSATLEPGMLALVAGSTTQTVAPTNEFNGRWQAKPLTTANRNQTTSGWVFFKINRGIKTPLQLRFNRPAYSVSTTGKSFPAKSFTVALTK